MGLMDSVESLRGALDYHLKRHNVLASNLAHVDTPNYTPKDLARTGSFDGAMKVALAATDAHHIGFSQGADGSSFRVINDKGASPAMDGNGVSVDREAVKIATNDIRYETISSLVADELNGLSWAANDGK
jgi:flagellar basal-body rod protein FlgB